MIFRCAFLGCLMACAAAAQESGAVLASPDGNLRIGFVTLAGGKPAASGQLAYEVSYGGKALIAPSHLGLALQGRPVLGAEVRIQAATPGSADESYSLVHGKSNPVRNHYRSLRVEALESTPGGRTLVVEARAYDDGVAFRYVVPEQAGAKDLRLTQEKTEFRIAKDSTAYPSYGEGFLNAYEKAHLQAPVSGIAPDQLVVLPLLIDVPGVAWMAITEAHLENWAGLYLRRNVPQSPTGFAAELPANLDEPALKVLGRTPHASPWRVILAAADPGRLVESNLVVNLNPPSAIADTSWIKAGKSVWNWWYGRSTAPEGWVSQMDTRTMLALIDFAARSGLEYLLIDAGWSDRTEITRPRASMDMPRIFEHARQKQVGIWLWLHWTGVDARMEEAFPLYEKWGVKGLKIDFMDRDDQWMVDWYHRVLKKAAEHRLMVDFHGAYKPTGERRTWPNLMTQEGVQGQEYSKWSFAIEPEHNLILPFTRMLAGPMDFTPGGFDNATRAGFTGRGNDPMVMGTRAHNMALVVVYESPFLVLCDKPWAYEGEAAFEFLKKAPATWDETRCLNAQVGDFITVARRRGQEWYVGSMTDWSARELEIPLSFLGGGRYAAEIYADAPDAGVNPKKVVIEKRMVERGMTLKARLAPGGGHCMRIVPAR